VYINYSEWNIYSSSTDVYISTFGRILSHKHPQQLQALQKSQEKCV
jgi:hypothetical protein